MALYERTIDSGGHPNEKAVFGALRIVEGEKETEFKQLYLNADSAVICHTMKNISQIGLVALYMFREIWETRFDIIGLTARMDAHQRVLLRT
jgi:hypothetical protein